MKTLIKYLLWVLIGLLTIAWLDAGMEIVERENTPYYLKLISFLPLMIWMTWTTGHLDFLKNKPHEN